MIKIGLKPFKLIYMKKLIIKGHLFRDGRDGITPSGSSVIDFKPEKDNSYLILISAKEFIPGITSGRFYLILASR
jgi:hypothetical protein